MRRLLWVLLCTVGLIFAQSDRGTITGTVSDPTGALVPGASVHAKNTDTGAEYQTVTTATGNFAIAQLPVGVYELSFAAPGFSRSLRQGIRVAVAQTVRLDVVMQLGSTAESITVASDAALLKTESAEQSHNVRTEMMNALPLNFAARGPGSLRDPFAFVQMLPGGRIEGRNDIRINGIGGVGTGASFFGVLLEGQDQTMPLGPGNSDMHAPSVEAVQEISVQTSNFAAEYGQAGSGLFNFTTKSGTNRIHGSAYEYLVNEALHAGRPYTDDGKGSLVRPRNRRHDYGGSLGGPVYIPKIYDGRDRTFFFANLEKYLNRQHSGGNYTTVPTLAMRGGDFSGVLTGRRLGTDPLDRAIMENTIYDPGTERIVNGLRVRNPFPDNFVDPSRFDPVAQKIQNLIPLPTREGNVLNFEQRYKTERQSEVSSLKLDHVFTSKLRLSYYEQYLRTIYLNNGADGLPAPLTSHRQGYARVHTIKTNVNYSVTPTLLVTAGAGMVRMRVPDEALDGVRLYDSIKELGLKGAIDLGMPRITGLGGNQGGMALGIGMTHATAFNTDKPTATLNATWVRNNHTFKAGGDFHRDIYTNRNREGTAGAYGFSALQTGLPSIQQQPISGGSVGYSYASFLLGLANDASIRNAVDPQLRKSAWALYVQDSWKVRRNLTLDIGLRWDYLPAMHELWDRISAFSPTVKNPSVGGLLGGTAYEGYGPGRCNCRFASNYPYALGPRLGVAYQFSPKTVIRGGFGISYARTADFNWQGAAIGVGYNTLTFTTTSYGDPAVVMRGGLNYNLADLYQAAFDPGIRPSPGQLNSPNALRDSNGGRPPRVMQWSIAVQREISKNLMLEVSYVGNRAAWLEANGLVGLNAMSPERLRSFGLDINNPTDRTDLRRQIGSSQVRARGFAPPYAGFPTTATLAQSLRQYPQFGNVDMQWAPLGNSWYDSLQIKGTKRYSHGLELMAGFTWQKELERTGGSVNDVFNRPNQKSLASQSQPFVFVTSFTYETPKLGANRVLRTMVGGWNFSGLFRYASGALIPVPGARNSLGQLLFQNTRMNRIEGEPLFLKDLDCHCIDPNKDFVLNPAAWRDPADGEWGVSAAYYNDFRYQRRPDEQLAVGRTFRVRERYRFHVRAEFFNVFNRTFMANPDAGNPLATQIRNPATGVPQSGFGRINATTLAGDPRFGQFVARFEF